MSMGRSKPHQGELWIPAAELKSPGHPFFERLDQVLAKCDFDRQAEEICKTAYAERNGRPSIPPGRYFRMLLIGYFEGIDSERGLAWRCQDSLSLKTFLGLGPADSVPDHSSLSVIRRRLPIEAFRKVFTLVLKTLEAEGLLKGKVIALDSSMMEANAAMRSIVRRDTKETYEGYVGRLAKAAGEPASTREELVRFDKQRPGRSTSNADWVSSSDPEAKISKMKDGRTRLAYKPEHAVDMDTGAIVAATVNHADQSDHETSTGTIVETTRSLSAIELADAGFLVVADKGYHSEAVLAGCATVEIETCIAMPRKRTRRRWKGKAAIARQAFERNRRRTRSEFGRRLQRRRGETVERSFAHVLETGRMRRTHLRGRENIEKRYLIQTSAFNLGLVLRKMTGFGTPRGLAAASAALLRALVSILVLVATGFGLRSGCGTTRRQGRLLARARPTGAAANENWASSTGC